MGTVVKNVGTVGTVRKGEKTPPPSLSPRSPWSPRFLRRSPRRSPPVPTVPTFLTRFDVSGAPRRRPRAAQGRPGAAGGLQETPQGPRLSFPSSLCRPFPPSFLVHRSSGSSTSHARGHGGCPASAPAGEAGRACRVCPPCSRVPGDCRRGVARARGLGRRRDAEARSLGARENREPWAPQSDHRSHVVITSRPSVTSHCMAFLLPASSQCATVRRGASAIIA